MADASVLAAAHPRHDLLLIASTLDRWRGPRPTLAQALIAACTECARLHADLVALATALPAAGTPRRTRDFTLSAADAERLRRGGWRGWLRRIGSSRDTITRPLALSLTTLGLAGLLIAAVPTVMPAGSDASSASPDIERGVAAPSDGGFHVEAAPPGEAAPLPPPAEPVEPAEPAEPADGPSPFTILSSGFFAAGLALFGVRRAARQRGAMR